jgi:uncharacterized damage-inducible protein DinB
MNTLTLVREMHQWLRWCTGRSSAAARELTQDELNRPFEMGLGSVYGTMLHLYGAERLWIHVLEGTADGKVLATRDELPTLDAIVKAWPAVHAQWDRYLAALTDAELDRIVIRVREGKEFRQRAVDALMQVPTHALYHNAQLSAMFRQMGRSLPDSSYINWARERISAAGAR